MNLKGGWLVPLLIVLVLASFSFPLGAPTVRAAVLYDSGNPTSAEQLVLEYINRARADPIAEGQRLGIDIHEGLANPSYVGPRPPLAMNKILLGIAETHSLNMYNQNYFSHNDPNGMTPFDRMTNAGYNFVTAGENMAGGSGATATQLEDLVMVDSGTPGRGHRVNLLDLFSPYPCGTPPCVYYEVGIGFYGASTSNGMGLSSLLTQDFGTTNVGPFLLGVVYNDLNHNNFYDFGEGIAGVTVTPSTGGYYAISSTAGGYAFPIGASGTITVTAAGPGFGPTTKTVTLNGANMKVDFTTSSQTSSITTSTLTTTQTSFTSTLSQTTTSSTITSSTITSISSTQTVTSSVNPPSIALGQTSAPAGSTIGVTGSHFSSSDTICSISGLAMSTFTCSISGGSLTASFVAANVAVGSYIVTATGSPVGDSAWAIFSVTASNSQTTSSTITSTILTSTVVTSSQTATQTNQTTTTVSLYTINPSSSQQTTTAATIVNPQTTNTTTPTTTSDFVLSASSNAISLAQASTGDLAVSLESVGPFNQQVTLEAVGLPDGVQVTFSPNPVNPSEGVQITSTARLVVTRSVPTGIYPFTIIATTGSISKQITLSLRVSGCLIATATFGSELAPEVQFLRDFRDNKVLQTFAGTGFMVAFNTWYYSFSPEIAQYETANLALRESVKIMIYPLIWILQIGSVVFDIFSFNPEAAALFSGIAISALLGTIYFTGPMIIVRGKLSGNKFRLARRFEKASIFVLAGALLIVALSEVLGAEMLMALGSSIIVVSTMTASGLWLSRGVIAICGSE